MHTLFLAIFSDEDRSQEEVEEVIGKIKASENQYFQLSPNAFIVKHLGLTSDVAKLVGIGEEAGAAGVVFALKGAHNGYESKDMWEWLEKHG